MHPTISVLMPVYNAERYVAEAVESILAQTFTDFEFLIIDDGSTDGSRAILERYAARDPRIRLTSRPNTGYVVALNEMLAVSRGEFIARMDADDIAMPERFALQVAYLRDHPDVVCVGGACLVLDSKGRPLIETQPACDDARIQEIALSGITPLCHPAVIMRREAVKAAGGYREEMMPAEDLDLFLRLGEVGQLANLPQIVLKYREHEKSVSQALHRAQLERMRAAADEACDRRGIERRCHGVPRGRPEANRRSRHEYSLRNGWWAFLRGDRWTALHYGLRSIRFVPWRFDGWRLLICALLRPVKEPG